jgi:hypothetical protein
MNFNFSKISLLAAIALVSVSYGQDKKAKSKTAKIDLSHWSVTVPEENPNKPGKPYLVNSPEILDYANDEILKKYMYDDPKDRSLVFYAYPSGTTTANTSYSRSELRETMVPGNNKVNWTFAKGGKMKGTYAIEDISKESTGKYSRVIIAQIHGVLTDEQRELIGQKDNNAAPILKIYWDQGKIRVKTKVLKDLNAEYKDMLSDHAWGDDEGRNFKEKVDFNKFTLEVKVSDGRMEVILNDNESFVYDDIHMKKWGIFENYFKAGNYFQSKTPGTFAKVKIYSLEVSH